MQPAAPDAFWSAGARLMLGGEWRPTARLTIRGQALLRHRGGGRPLRFTRLGRQRPPCPHGVPRRAGPRHRASRGGCERFGGDDPFCAPEKHREHDSHAPSPRRSARRYRCSSLVLAGGCGDSAHTLGRPATGPGGASAGRRGDDVPRRHGGGSGGLLPGAGGRAARPAPGAWRDCRRCGRRRRGRRTGGRAPAGGAGSGGRGERFGWAARPSWRHRRGTPERQRRRRSSGAGAAVRTGGTRVGGAGGVRPSPASPFRRSIDCALTDADCFAAMNIADCCGRLQYIGLHTTEQTRYTSLEQQCQTQWPACACADAADDHRRRFHDQERESVGVTCRQGVCTTFVPACGGPCAAGLTCFSCQISGGLYGACTTPCTDAVASSDCTNAALPAL